MANINDSYVGLVIIPTSSVAVPLIKSGLFFSVTEVSTQGTLTTQGPVTPSNAQLSITGIQMISGIITMIKFEYQTYVWITSIASVSIANGGSAYEVGDILSIPRAGALGRVTVNTVDGSGAILTITILNAGYGYSVANNLVTYGGSGTGALINILTINRNWQWNSYPIPTSEFYWIEKSTFGFNFNDKINPTDFINSTSYIEAGYTINPQIGETSPTIDSGSGISKLYRFRVGFLNADNIVCSIQGSASIIGTFGTIIGNINNYYVTFTRTSGDTLLTNQYAGRKVRIYASGTELNSTENFIIINNTATTVTIFLNNINSLPSATSITITQGEVGGDYLYFLGESPNTTLYYGEVIGVPFNGISDFLELAGVTGMAIYQHTSDTTGATNDDNISTDIPSFVLNVNEAKLEWDNMYANTLVTSAGMADGTTQAGLKPIHWQNITSYAVFMFVSNAGASPAAFNPSLTDANGTWYVVGEVAAPNVSATLQPKIQTIISNLPLGKYVGFWVGAKTDTTPSNTLMKMPKAYNAGISL